RHVAAGELGVLAGVAAAPSAGVGGPRVPATPQSLPQVLGTVIADPRGCFARAPRRLELVTWIGMRVPIEPVLHRWRDLPVAAIAMNGVTLEKSPELARVDRTASADTRAALRRILPDVPIVE